MATTLKQLGQLMPTNTTAASLYSPGASTQTLIKSIVVCNTSGDPVAYRVFHDDNGTTYDTTTALYYDVALAGNTTIVLEFNLAMNDSTGNLAVRTDRANNITFTCYGAEIT
jgi:hypothetical protein